MGQVGAGRKGPLLVRVNGEEPGKGVGAGKRSAVLIRTSLETSSLHFDSFLKRNCPEFVQSRKLPDPSGDIEEATSGGKNKLRKLLLLLVSRTLEGRNSFSLTQE